MNHRGIASYAQTQFETGHRGDILVALYDGALRFAGQAKEAIGRRDPVAKGPAIDRLLAVIMEFSRTLDPGPAPELARNLQAIYGYCIARAQEASVQMSVAPIDDVIGHLTRLRGTWAEAVSIAKRA